MTTRNQAIGAFFSNERHANESFENYKNRLRNHKRAKRTATYKWVFVSTSLIGPPQTYRKNEK